MSRLREDCWVCQNLDQPKQLVFYESNTSIAKLNPDQYFHGYTFLTLKSHMEELHQLTSKTRQSFLNDIALVGNALAMALQPDKMNYELLGNAQPHLHWHIIPRYKSDPLWGRPIWVGNRRRNRLSQDQYVELLEKVRAHIAQPTGRLKPPE